MKPLIALLTVFVIACGVTYQINGQTDILLSGRAAMAVMLLFTAMGHFKFADGMAMMLPPAIPFKKPIVWATGVIEIAGAIGLLTTLHQLTGKLLIIFFILITPANIYAATRKVNLEKANYEGDGLNYLWFRIPLQILFIGWIWYFAIAP